MKVIQSLDELRELLHKNDKMNIAVIIRSYQQVDQRVLEMQNYLGSNDIISLRHNRTIIMVNGNRLIFLTQKNYKYQGYKTLFFYD